MWKFVDIGSAQKIFYGIDKLILSKKTKYQLLEIVETKDFGTVLFLDGDPQSSEKDEHIFNECLVHPSMIVNDKPKNVFIGGGGTGLTLREILRHKSVKQVDIVDIDEEVVDICKNFYDYAKNSFSDNRVRLYHEDARKFLESTNSKYDCMFLDTTMPHHEDIAAPLYRKEFFEIVRDRLHPEGIFATAANSADFRYSDRFASIVKTLESVFTTVRPYTAYTPLFGQEWAFVFASNNVDTTILEPKEVDQKLAKNGCTGLNFYDGMTHKRIFSLDKMIAKILKESGNILTDDKNSRDEIFVPEISKSCELENFVNMVEFSERELSPKINNYTL